MFRDWLYYQQFAFDLLNPRVASRLSRSLTICKNKKHNIEKNCPSHPLPHYPLPGPNTCNCHNLTFKLLKTESLDNAILELWLAQPSWYMSHSTMLSKYGNCTRLLEIKTSWKWVVFTNKVGNNFVGVFNKTLFHSRLLDRRWLLPTHI